MESSLRIVERMVPLGNKYIKSSKITSLLYENNCINRFKKNKENVFCHKFEALSSNVCIGPHTHTHVCLYIHIPLLSVHLCKKNLYIDHKMTWNASCVKMGS